MMIRINKGIKLLILLFTPCGKLGRRGFVERFKYSNQLYMDKSETFNSFYQFFE